MNEPTGRRSGSGDQPHALALALQLEAPALELCEPLIREDRHGGETLVEFVRWYSGARNEAGNDLGCGLYSICQGDALPGPERERLNVSRRVLERHGRGIA